MREIVIPKGTTKNAVILVLQASRYKGNVVNSFLIHAPNLAGKVDTYKSVQQANKIMNWANKRT